MKKKRSGEKGQRRQRGEASKINLSDVPPGGALAIQPLKKDPNLRRISVAGKTVALLPVSAVEEIGISEKTRWSEELGRLISASLERARARKIAMKLLSRKGLSRDEVRERLKKRGHAEAIAATVVADLESQGWIDEKAVAENVVREAARRGPATGEFVRRKLRERKLGDAAADHAAKTSAAPASGLDDAEKFARKRLAKMDAELKPSTKARRVARALAGRGFDDETISTILNRIDLGGKDNDE